MPATVRVGLLGAGVAARAIATSFARPPDVTVVAVWSRTRDRAAQLAAAARRECGAVLSTWETLVEQADIDVLALAVPPALRLEPIAAAFRRGLHVLTEKPFAVDLAAAGRWRPTPRSWSGRRGLLQLALHPPAASRPSAPCGRACIGRVLDFSTEWRQNLGDWGTSLAALLQRSPYRGERAAGGGMVREIGCHEFDRIRFLTGDDFTAVSGRGGQALQGPRGRRAVAGDQGHDVLPLRGVERESR